MTIDYRIGDVFDRLHEIPAGSISLVATSPPFMALRSYLPADHPDKAKEIGSEANPAAFLSTLLALTAEWARVLAPWGSIAVELGDTFTGAGGYGNPDSPNPAYGAASFEARYEGRTVKRFKRAEDGWPLAKCLALIPQLYAASLAYGFNLLTGESCEQWLIRNMVVWHRPNPAVGALGDKYRPSTSYITVATRSKARWFDLTAVRGDPSPNTHKRLAKGTTVADRTGKSADRDGNFDTMPELSTTAGGPPLDCWFDGHDTWTVTTSPSSLAHYAMWPPKLAERIVLSMCPLEVCSVCNEPRRRVEGKAEYVTNRGGPINYHMSAFDRRGPNVKQFATIGDNSAHRTAPTLGWTDCEHDAYRPGLVLDPFCGTGTTLAVADLHGRDAIGIDIDARNRDLLARRTDEVKRSLFGTRPEVPGQTNLFDLEPPSEPVEFPEETQPTFVHLSPRLDG